MEKLFKAARESEDYIIANLLVSPALISKVLTYITKPEQFSTHVNRKIFTEIAKRVEKGEPFDLAIVANSLTDMMGEVADLSAKATTGYMIEEHCMVVYENYCRKEFSVGARAIIEGMMDANVDFIETLNAFDQLKDELLSFSLKEEKHISEAVKDMQEKSIRLNKKEDILGIPTGFTYFDEFSGGIQRGDLIIVAGETSNGKTTLALNMMQNSAKRGSRVAVFSYEMTTFQLAARMVAYERRIPSKDIIRGDIDEGNLRRITDSVSRLTSSYTYIVKPHGTSFSRLVQDIVRMVGYYKLDLIVVDYLQLLNNGGKHGSTADLIAEMANRLKSLAVELNVSIVLISQLARSQNPRPNMSRLKGSGDIENAADVVMFSYLPYKYGNEQEEVNGNHEHIGENAIIIVDKGRNIGTTQFILEFKKEVPGFFNYNNFTVPEEITQADNFIEPMTSDYTPFG